MVMPLAGRAAAAVIGGLLVLASMSSVTGTLIVSRSVSSGLTRWVDRIVNRAYQLVVPRAADYWRRDRMLATEAAAILLAHLAAWLFVAYAGFALLLPDVAAEHGADDVQLVELDGVRLAGPQARHLPCVDHDAVAAVAGVELSHQVGVPGGELLGVRRGAGGLAPPCGVVGLIAGALMLPDVAGVGVAGVRERVW
jgi:hypothetical protein